MVTDISKDTTDVGNYFIANYPPFSFWKPEHLHAIEKAFQSPPQNEAPLGLYMHIPFCRKRCKFCYFKVYTDVNAEAIQHYADALAHEVAMVAQQPAVQGRQVRFAYFGGGTPSYLSVRQLHGLTEKLRQHVTWDQAEEVTFECEPGTLSEPKVAALKEIGVTRLSLGVENFSDQVLEENGRAHLSGEVYRAWEWIQKAGFAQVNIDLIAGMVGETQDNWEDNIRRVIEMSPDSVTIYQMELPYNTRYSNQLRVLGQPVEVANWSTKRAWVNYAFDELCAAGYKISSAYTLVKDNTSTGSSFHYRDHLWHGADLIGTGVASFGHLSGVHYQNIDTLEKYEALLQDGRLPLGRAMGISDREKLIREMILQLKTGYISADYFRKKFGVEILSEYGPVFEDYRDRQLLEIQGDDIRLTREGLLRVDSLLPAFFLPEHRSDRYT